MPEYRDYGVINGENAPQIAVNTAKRTQVYDITHDGAGNYLPYMNRSFISFSYGGKNIEDFNLLAIIENNSLQRKLYADFSDNVTESDVWDGQIYWSSHFNSNSIDFALFTDGITDNKLDEFKQYFTPGKIAELIVSEHPNRAIMARVAVPPEISVLPFEQKVTIKIAGRDYETSTTLYKGRISLNFVMDDPFWYSKANILDEYQAGKWIDANGHETLILNDKDALKVLKEDGVPFSDMLNRAAEELLDSTIILFGTEDTLTVDTSMNATGSRVGNSNNNEGARVGQGHVAYVILNGDAGITIGPDTYGYFFYAGNAACYPIINFSLTPTLNVNGYIQLPANKYTSATSYSTITIQCTDIQKFMFTTPSIYTGYNQVIDIFRQTGLASAAWEDIRASIRNNVKHWAPRQYANHVIDEIAGNTTRATVALLTQCRIKMQDFLKDNDNVICPANFTINCKNGQATGQFIYRNKLENEMTTIENVGDMVCSSYLVIKEKNVPDDDGYIQPWTEGKNYSYRVNSDCTLNNFNLQYKYLYL